MGTTESFYFWVLYRIASLEPYRFSPRGTSETTLALLTADQETEEGPTWQEPWKHLTEIGKALLTLSSQALWVLSGDFAVNVSGDNTQTC